jgi:peptidoglycan/xylan/chitin deacetylase (PgdA/CDA1 family)
MKNINNLTIVMYHYVRDLKNSKFPGIKGLELSSFIEQIQYIKKNYHPVTMEEVIYCIENQSKIPDKSILLTFDDAYSDHYSNVFPILQKNKIQGSFYIPSKVITEHKVLDVNKIHFILASSFNILRIIDDIKLLINSYKSQYKLYDFDYYYKKLAHKNSWDSKEVIFVKRLLQVELTEDLRTKIVDILFTKYIGISEFEFSNELYMNEEDLVNMLNCGMHIGSHGHNHFWWNALTQSEIENELNLSCDFLQRIGVDMTNWTACYPYGSYDDQSVNMLSKKGCKLAVTVDTNIAKTNKEDRFLMPRLDTNDLPKNRAEKPNKWYHQA